MTPEPDPLPAPSPAPAPAPAPKPAPKTAIEADDPPADPAPRDGLPENWRKYFTDETDTDGLAELNRYKSPKEVTKALLEQKKLLRKGADAVEEAPDGEKDPEGLAKWREKRGIPAEPTGYTVPDEIKGKLKDNDKPIVDGYMQWAHKRNLTPKEVQNGVAYYTELQAALEADQAEADKAQMTETMDTLRSTWGPDHRANSRLAASVAKSIVPGVDFFLARDPKTGKMFGNMPEFVEAMHEIGVLQGRQADYEDGETKGGEDELASLREQMKDARKWRANKKGQARFQELIEKQERRAQR